MGRWFHLGAFTFCLCVLAWLGTKTVRSAWRVTSANVNAPALVDVGRFAQEHLPENAVLFCQETAGGEHLTLMFYADRTCYPLSRGEPGEMARVRIQADYFFGKPVAGGKVVVSVQSRDAGEPRSEPVRIQHLLATVLHTLFDVGELRLVSGAPREIAQTMTAWDPIPGLHS